MKEEQRKRVSVVGIGTMGKKLVTLLKVQYEVIVWNRTVTKALEIPGVQIAGSPEEAFRQANTIVMCLYDYAAVKEVIYGIKDRTALEGKTLINFTTGSPTEAGEIESFLTQNHADYINGALQVAPDQMGLDVTTIILSGKEQAFKKEETLLRLFGGNIRYLGESASLASAVDLATLSWLYGSYIGLIYAVDLCVRTGISLPVFNSILEGIIPGFAAFFKHQVETIDKGDFTVQQSPMSISIAASQRIKAVFEQQEVPTQFWQSIADLFQQADKRGLGNQEVASIIQVLR